MKTRDAIAAAAETVIRDDGVANLTIATVSKRARVSSALVHYHFATKEKLLVVAAQRIANGRAVARVAALRSPAGLAMLDALWASLTSDDGRGSERSWHDVALLARSDPLVAGALREARRTELDALTAVLPDLLGALGGSPDVPMEELAAVVLAFLDGLALQVDEGVRPNDLRSVYDAFWLALAAGGVAPVRPS